MSVLEVIGISTLSFEDSMALKTHLSLEAAGKFQIQKVSNLRYLNEPTFIEEDCRYLTKFDSFISVRIGQINQFVSQSK